MVPKQTNSKNPAILAFFPTISLANLPISNPKSVKQKLVILKINMVNILLLVIASSPKPVEKASIETPKANKNMPKYDKSISTSSSLFKFINKLIAKKSKIPPNNLLEFKAKKLTIELPSKLPIEGIIKCIIPTIKLNLKQSFLFMLYVPTPSDREKVSILRATAIKKDEKNSTIF